MRRLIVCCHRTWNALQVATGSGIACTPPESGFLYCFANDAWEACGRVRLTAAVKPLGSAPRGSAA